MSNDCANATGPQVETCGFVGGSTLGWGPVGPADASAADWRVNGGAFSAAPWAGPIAVAGWHWFDMDRLERITASTVQKYPPGWAYDALADPDALMARRSLSWEEIVYDISARACDLLAEFVCHRASETLDHWNDDYGIPDACGINDLCAKVAAIGGADCSYLTSLAARLGYSLCCDEVPTEVQVGCWQLGVDPMPPAVDWRYGGSELGFAMLGVCVGPDAGSGLGQVVQGPEDCNIAGYYDDSGSGAVDAPCSDPAACTPWLPPVTGTLLTGCGRPYGMNYTGTAYHFWAGVPQPVDTGPPQYAVTGSWSMGCVSLCQPPRDEVLCFIARYRPAHTVPVPRYC